MNKKQPILSEKEIFALCDALSLGENHDVSEEEQFRAVRWAEKVVIQYQLLQLIKEGKVKMFWQADDATFVFGSISA